MVTLWQIISYTLFVFLAIFVFSFMLHIIMILLSKRKNRVLKLRVAEDYDFTGGWKTGPEEGSDSIDNYGKDKGGF